MRQCCSRISANGCASRSGLVFKSRFFIIVHVPFKPPFIILKDSSVSNLHRLATFIRARFFRYTQFIQRWAQRRILRNLFCARSVTIRGAGALAFNGGLPAAELPSGTKGSAFLGVPPVFSRATLSSIVGALGTSLQMSG